MAEMTTIASRIKYAREQSGLSVRQAAGKLQILEDLQQMEDGHSPIYAADLPRMADVYGVSPCWLLIGGTTVEAEESVAALRKTEMRTDDVESLGTQLASMRGTRRNA